MHNVTVIYYKSLVVARNSNMTQSPVVHYAELTHRLTQPPLVTTSRRRLDVRFKLIFGKMWHFKVAPVLGNQLTQYPMITSAGGRGTGVHLPASRTTFPFSGGVAVM
jgi:hypothetical protein